MAKVNASIEELNKLMRLMKKDYRVRVGIIGNKAATQHDGTNITNAYLGGVHEFGADITIPAHKISVYRSINAKGEFKFDGKFRKKKLKSTNWQEEYNVESYDIDIPARSFLRQPLEEKMPEVITGLKKEIFKDCFIKNNPSKVFNMIGSKALEIVHDAFDTGGFGQWKELAKSTKNYKSSNNLSPEKLIARGQLKNSTSFKVVKND